nr:hypothetical protein [Actinomycetota bacterium]
MGRKLAVILVVLLLLLLVIPLGIGMVMAPCPECDAGTLMGAIMACVAILLASTLLLLSGATGSHRPDLYRFRAPPFIRNPDPPPRPA